MSDEDDSTSVRSGPRTAADIQRRKLEKLMKNPDKPVHIPESSAKKPGKDPNKAPEFVYNVMGSSAGAGSGEFHVYRQIRRKEMLRQKIISKEREKEELNEAFQMKLLENEKKLQEKNEKKRKRNQKKKEAKKRMRKLKKNKEDNKDSDDDTDDSDDSEEEEQKEDDKKKTEDDKKETEDDKKNAGDDKNEREKTEEKETK